MSLHFKIQRAVMGFFTLRSSEDHPCLIEHDGVIFLWHLTNVSVDLPSKTSEFSPPSIKLVRISADATN